MKERIKAIIEQVNSGELKLKDAKPLVTELSCDTVQAEAAKTKAAFVESLEVILMAMDEVEEPLTELDRLKVEIQETIVSIGKSSLHLGKLLLEAKEACDSMNDFLAWVGDNFGIKKAWAYKLMKVATVFTDEVWAGVSSSVLYTLASQNDEELTAQARELAEAGELNHNTLAELVKPSKPKEVQSPESLEKVSQQAAQEAQEALSFDTGANIQLSIKPQSLPEDVEELASKPLAADEMQARLLAKISELTASNSELVKKMESYQAQILELSKPKLRNSNMPMLRQFHSSNYAARLGLTAEEANDKAIILEAFKELCKAGYGRGHEAFELIDQARHELIHAIK